MHTGEIIKRLRIQCGYTQEQLGCLLGVKKSAVQKYENGMIQNLKICTIRKMCEIFDVPPFLFIFPEKVNDHSPSIEMFTGLRWLDYASNFAKLNIIGRQKVVDYSADLCDTEKYNICEIEFE